MEPIKILLKFVFVMVYFCLFISVVTSTSKNIPLQQFFHPQPLDHLGFGFMSKLIFQQKYYINHNFIQNAKVNNSPIIVYLGGEAPLETQIKGGNGITSMVAEHLHSLVVYIEHRFYGESVPFESIDLAMSDSEVRGCMTSVQALADFVDIIRTIKQDSSFSLSPVIVVGGSYAGMLAAWMRLKYPHIVAGALSSSAPIFRPIDLPPEKQYCTIASKDFKDTNKKCYNNIKKSWKLIDEVALQGGLDNLSTTFESCSPIISVSQLKVYLEDIYNMAAQYDGRFHTITKILCKKISSPRNILDGISQAVFELSEAVDCNNITFKARNPPSRLLDQDSEKVWKWQLCSELLPPEGCGHNTMFESSTFNLTAYMDYCFRAYGVKPHPNVITTYYGGLDIISALKTFGSNIIFSNGLRDPLSGASILEDISNTIVAVTTKKGSHCLDIGPIRKDDPKWLKKQRRKELKIISRWIKELQSTSGGEIITKTRFIWQNILVIILTTFIY